MRARDVHGRRVIAGLLFAAIGTGFLLESLDVWTVNLVYVWPTILIAVGVSVLLGRAKRAEIEETRSASLAVAEERVRIARELHDIVAHGVSLMTIQIAAARRVAKTKPAAADEALLAAENAGRQSLAELRSLLSVLRSADASLEAATIRPAGAGDDNERYLDFDDDAPLEPLPRLADVDDLVDSLRTAGLDVKLTVLGEPLPVPAGVELAAYRVIQESLTNALRHAGNARVEVTLLWGDRELGIEVVDDGAGELITTPAAPVGHGLVGMRERVAAVHGRLDIGPRVGMPGWRVAAVLPAGRT